MFLLFLLIVLTSSFVPIIPDVESILEQHRSRFVNEKFQNLPLINHREYLQILSDRLSLTNSALVIVAPKSSGKSYGLQVIICILEQFNNPFFVADNERCISVYGLFCCGY